MPTLVTHFVEWDAIGRSRVRAVCGAWIRRREHVNLPTCPDCRRALARLDALRSEDDTAPISRSRIGWGMVDNDGLARRRGDV